MVTIKVIGTTPPCVKCRRVTQEAQKVADKYPGQVEVVKVDALSAEAERYGMLVTPVLIINEQVVSRGQVLNADQIERKLNDIQKGDK